MLPVRHLGTLDLRAESGEEEELKLAVASTFFVTVQTTTRKLQVVQSPFPSFLSYNTTVTQVWSKTCSLLDSFDIWDLSGRCVVARGDTVVVAGRPKIDIVSCLDHEGALPLTIQLIYKFSLQVKLVVDGCSGVEPSSLSLECRNDSLIGEPASVCEARL